MFEFDLAWFSYLVLDGGDCEVCTERSVKQPLVSSMLGVVLLLVFPKKKKKLFGEGTRTASCIEFLLG